MLHVLMCAHVNIEDAMLAMLTSLPLLAQTKCGPSIPQVSKKTKERRSFYGLFSQLAASKLQIQSNSAYRKYCLELF